MKKKSLAFNSIYNTFYKALNAIFPLITSAYIARVLLADGVGKVSYAQNIVSYFAIVAYLGIPNYGTRELPKCNNINSESKLFSELMVINSFSTTICLVAYYIMIISVDYFRSDLKLYLVTGMTIAFNYLNVDWFYQGKEEFAYIAFRSFIVKILSLICILIFVRDKSDIIAYAMIYCLGIGGNNLFNILHLKKYNIRLILSGLSIKEHLKPVILLLQTSIAIELYTLLDTTMIGIICEDVNVAYYTNSTRIVKLLITIITAIGGVLLPRLSYFNAIGKQDECEKIVNRVFYIMLFLFLPSQVGLFLISDDLIPILFGNSFLPAVTTFKISTFLICTLGFSNLFGTQVLLTYNCEKKLLIATIVGALTNICLNLLLIPRFAQNGAAFASVISELCVTLLTYIYSRRYIKIFFYKRCLISQIVSVIILALIVYYMNILLAPVASIIRMCLAIIVGGISYLVTNICLKNPIFQEIVDFVRER